ncbi:gluconokinase [Octadecabacter sp.]|nr:gluconokinase [Octadecabacter sp.]
MIDMKVVVMGVAGSGKSTLGAAIAKELNCPFIDADDLHPEENITHMSSGRPLTDAMRWPWLDACGASLKENDAVVLGCSALKRSYRDRLRIFVPDLQLVYPNIPEAVIRKRFEGREGHFMPDQLITSQFETLEEPHEDEDATVIAAALSIGQAAKLAASHLLAK